MSRIGPWTLIFRPMKGQHRTAKLWDLFLAVEWEEENDEGKGVCEKGNIRIIRNGG